MSKYKVRLNPNRDANKNHCCCFCGLTRSVKYLVDLHTIYGERVLTVEACNRCVLLLNSNIDTTQRYFSPAEVKQMTPLTVVAFCNSPYFPYITFK